MLIGVTPRKSRSVLNLDFSAAWLLLLGRQSVRTEMLTSSTEELIYLDGSFENSLSRVYQNHWRNLGGEGLEEGW